MFLLRRDRHHKKRGPRWFHLNLSLDSNELAKLQDAADKSDAGSADEHLAHLAHERTTSSLESPRTMSSLEFDGPTIPQNAYIHVLGPDELEPDHEHSSSHFYLEQDELLDSMGVSGLCILSHSSGLYEKCTLVSIALQAFVMQFVIFHFMWMYIVRAEKPSPSDIAGPVKRAILIVAVYVHLMNILRDIPFGLSIMFTFPWLQHGWKESIFAAPIFMIDSVIVPSITAVLGSLFLCTSTTTSEVLLNSCAVFFVNGIDNFLLKLSVDFKDFSRSQTDHVVFVPYQPKMVACLDYTVVVFPIIPLLWALSMEWLGRDSLELYYPEEADTFT